MTFSDDQGKSFSRDRAILSNVCECCRSNLQIDSRGNLLLAYRTVPPDGPIYRDIILASSENRGNSFTTRVVSHDGWDINACPVAGPALCVDGSNRVTVIWFTAGDRPGLYYAESLNSGASFSPRKLLDADQTLGKHAQAVARANGTILVAWDGVTTEPVVRWGVLDRGSGKIERLGALSGASYPVVTEANGGSFVVAALNAAQHNVAVQTGQLMPNASTR